MKCYFYWEMKGRRNGITIQPAIGTFQVQSKNSLRVMFKVGPIIQPAGDIAGAEHRLL
jgi:hypothetical protein